MGIDMGISTHGDEVSLSIVNYVSTFPTTKAIEEIVDKLLVRKIHEYYEGKLINDHDKFVMLELNYGKLKTFTKKLEDGHISRGLKVCFLETMDFIFKCKFVDKLLKASSSS